MKRNALIILERPWFVHDKDQNTSSVLPFFQGLQRLNDNFDLYHTNFYEANSFGLALDELTRLDYDNYFVYIACHGQGRRLENINLSNALKLINLKAQSKNIVGVVLGSCLVGKNVSAFEAYTEASSIIWKFGYKCSVGWLEGTMLDVKVFSHLIGVRKDIYTDRNKVLSKFKQVLKTYRPESSIGTDLEENPIEIQDSLTLVVQPQGQGFQAKDVSAALFDD